MLLYIFFLCSFYLAFVFLYLLGLKGKMVTNRNKTAEIIMFSKQVSLYIPPSAIGQPNR